MPKSTTMKLLVPVLALGLTLTACGGDSDGASSATGPHNDQDVTFATEMIPHHSQAVDMTDLVAGRAESQEVIDLAGDISAAQGPEIEQMTSWLESWGEEVPDTSGGMEGMDGDMEGMSGMMSSAEMSGLEEASGRDFDEMFLTMMIEHHEGAVEMADVEQAEGEFPDAVDLAEQISESQTEEIEVMKDLLAEL